MRSFKMTKPKELRNLTEQELRQKQTDLYRELFSLNQQRYAGRVEKPHSFRQVKKDIARIKTILNEESYKEK